MTVAPKPADDRRIAERWNLSLPVPVKDALSGEPMGKIVNLSMHGLTLIGERLLVLEHRYELHLLPSGGEIGAPGGLLVPTLSVWNKPIGDDAYACGMHIFRLNSPDALKLEQLIAALEAPVNNN